MAKKIKKPPKPARTAKKKSKAKSDLPSRIIDAALAGVGIDRRPQATAALLVLGQAMPIGCGAL